MKKNMTVVFSKPCEIIWQEDDIPAPGKGQLLIKTLRTMISLGTEFSILERKNVPEGSVWDHYGTFPFTPGYSNIGLVEDVGEGVGRSWVGKKVATYGAHASYVLADAENARLIRPDISDDCAVFFTFAEIVMQGIRRGKVSWGEAVVIFGMGILGQMTARFCRLCGAKPVFAVEVDPVRLAKLPKDIGIIPVNPQTEDLPGIVKEKTKGRLADVVYEVTGVAELIPDEFEVLHHQGRFVVLSSPRGKTLFDFHDLCNWPSHTIIGAHNYAHPKFESPDNPWTNQRDAEYFFDMIADNEVELESLISTRIHYSDAVDYYYKLLQNRSGEMGIVIEWA